MDARTILVNNGLSNTKNRVNILQTLSEANIPLSGKEIALNLSEKCDKSTVYRTLNSLFERKILQRVIVDHEVKYALRNKNESDKSPGHDHLHFKCSHCQELFCLKEIEVEDFTLPAGFLREENQFLVIGKCRECQQ